MGNSVSQFVHDVLGALHAYLKLHPARRPQRRPPQRRRRRGAFSPSLKAYSFFAPHERLRLDIMSAKIISPFKFATAPVTILAVILYAAVFTSVLQFDQLADVPKRLNGLDLDRGYEALSEVRCCNIANFYFSPAVTVFCTRANVRLCQ